MKVGEQSRIGRPAWPAACAKWPRADLAAGPPGRMGHWATGREAGTWPCRTVAILGPGDPISRLKQVEHSNGAKRKVSFLGTFHVREHRVPGRTGGCPR